MPGKVTTQPRPSYYGVNLEQTLTAANQATDWVKLSGKVALQITGPATAASLQVERSTRDPADGPNSAPAGDPITGNPSTGLQPRAYEEPGVAWWRARCVALTGASVLVSLNGVGA